MNTKTKNTWHILVHLIICAMLLAGVVSPASLTAQAAEPNQSPSVPLAYGRSLSAVEMPALHFARWLSAAEMPALHFARWLSAVEAPAPLSSFIDPTSNTPLAVDPLGDMTEPSLDLHRLFVAEDAENYYIAFDAFVGNYGMNYGIYIDTDLINGSGAASDPWGRAVNAVAEHRPEHTLYVWHPDSGLLEDAQLNHWDGSSWSYDTLKSQGGEQSFNPNEDWFEYRLPKSALGNPARIAIELFTTGGGGHAQDTVPSDPNVAYTIPDWGPDVTTLSHFAIYPVPQVDLLVTAPVEGVFVESAEVRVQGSVSPAEGSTVNLDRNGTDLGALTLVGGVFDQMIALEPGLNTLTFLAENASATDEVVRHVYYGGQVDGVVLTSALRHDSRDPAYRTPGGPQPTSVAVTLRLRAAHNDLSAAQARVYNDRTNTQSFIEMQVAATDSVYDWWEVTLPASNDPTIYWYRFLALDGSATVYYEDDGGRDGGLGMPYEESPDHSWQLTLYDPTFQTPDWVKDSILYQIFPDRFRDGDPSNNTPSETFFYSETLGTVYRSFTTDWNTVVCDPRLEGDPCSGTYSKNFYGGDLQGIIDKLDYLVDLGVTAIYLNPIFESPSNHKYDTSDYSLIDDNFGDLATFITLTQELENRGMHLVLDGVFNHTSSDSIYFDRYGRYAEVGACESPDSPYRDWYYFTDVTPGTGACAGSDGTPNAAKYESWFGYDSLPKLQAGSQDARDLIWAQSVNSVAPYWIDQGADGFRLDVAGDVDPGVTSDPTNDYWEGFRDALHAVNPEAYIVGEEWGNATPWTLGGEWDATMNYQYSSAILSFWRDTPFVDNDHNSGSSAGELNPITPSQLDARLQNWQERYAPEAYYAMMNLLGSHDTSRPLFMLDHNTNLNNPSLYQDPDYDWSDAMVRLQGVVLLQMTLPGAPTIYYGDEVGLVGPVGYANGKWEDDPYNRQPFPWLDETPQPFYNHLQTLSGQDQLRDYYKLLAWIRNGHPALRTGSFDALLSDDANRIYAFGRLLPDYNDAAIVITNRQATSQTVELDLSGYLPYGAILQDATHGDNPYPVGLDGLLTIDIPAMSGAILVSNEALSQPPAAVSDLAVIREDDGLVALGWSAASGADRYHVYRSLLFGGGYQWITDTASLVYTDTSGLTNGVDYYYVVISEDEATGLQSAYSNEVSGVPHYLIAEALLIGPVTITHTIGLTSTEIITGQVIISGVTSLAGATSGLLAQVGFGNPASAPASWMDWGTASYAGEGAAGVESYTGSLRPEAVGDYAYVFRFSTTGGRDWVYADLDGAIPDPHSAASNPGLLTVQTSSDTTPPSKPENLRATNYGAGFVALAWDASSDNGLPGSGVYAYDLFRTQESNIPGEKIARILSLHTVYTDTSVSTGQTYTYTVQALDTSFNRSDLSDPVQATPAPKLVNLKLTVTVPAYTPGIVYFSREINPDGTLGGWNPSGEALVRVDSATFTGTLSILEGANLQFKFTRGNWETVEKDASQNEIADRQLLVTYGVTGVQNTSLTVVNWRDPIVVDYFPPTGAVNVPITTTLWVTWSIPMSANSQFSVIGPSGPVAGVFNYTAATQTVTFSPNAPLQSNSVYTVNVTDQIDGDDKDLQQVPITWSFTTETRETYLYLPFIFR